MNARETGWASQLNLKAFRKSRDRSDGNSANFVKVCCAHWRENPGTNIHQGVARIF